MTESINKVNPKLKEYIISNILTEYEKNDSGHNIEHINYVIRRSLLFASKADDIDYDMVYTIAAYHDIGHYISPKEHEKIAANIFDEDKFMKEYFSDEKREIIKDAILDHRASLKTEPKTIYGKIVSSADRSTSIDNSIRRAFTYRLKNNFKEDLNAIIEDSLKHITDKFGSEGYAKEKMYFHDEEYIQYLNDVQSLIKNPEAFKERVIKTNKVGDSDEFINFVYHEITNNNNLSLDESLYYTFNKMITNETFEEAKDKILKALKINEFDYYTKTVDKNLIDYITSHIFKEYDKNDKGHGLEHILEVIRRSFALNETFKLNLDKNMIYVIAAFHDIGKHIDNSIHEKIAAEIFMKDEFIRKFFSKEKLIVMKDAILDHRSSKKDKPKTTYGELVSSADRNTSINTVFKRSFYVGLEKQPDTSVDDYLKFTRKRLIKKYSLESPENMFYEDFIYANFLQEMRLLLDNEKDFEDKYCLVNNLSERNLSLSEIYTKNLKH